MGKLEAIEKQIEGLSGEELAQFRAWFAEYDEAEVKSGKLGALFNEAIADDEAGKSREL